MSVQKVIAPIQLALIHDVNFPLAAAQVILVLHEAVLSTVTRHMPVDPNGGSDESQAPPTMTEIMIVTTARKLAVLNITQAGLARST